MATEKDYFTADDVIAAAESLKDASVRQFEEPRYERFVPPREYSITGRALSKPHLQQIPLRTEFGRQLRRAFSGGAAAHIDARKVSFENLHEARAHRRAAVLAQMDGNDESARMHLSEYRLQILAALFWRRQHFARKPR